MPTCFIIMPISTPDHDGAPYSGDKNHFANVLEHLFVPAVEKIGYSPIRPTAEGADIIHAEIIKQLETADLVLCDMSTLNPNVLFEFGIRTAVNKPICVVKDERTTKIPFDTGIINHHTYPIRPWNQTQAIADLVKHLTKSVERCDGTNPLWKYFGLSKAAEVKSNKSGMEAKIDLLQMQVETITRNMPNETSETSRRLREVETDLLQQCQALGMDGVFIALEIRGSKILITTGRELTAEERHILVMLLREYPSLHQKLVSVREIGTSHTSTMLIE